MWRSSRCSTNQSIPRNEANCKCHSAHSPTARRPLIQRQMTSTTCLQFGHQDDAADNTLIDPRSTAPQESLQRSPILTNATRARPAISKAKQQSELHLFVRISARFSWSTLSRPGSMRFRGCYSSGRSQPRLTSDLSIRARATVFRHTPRRTARARHPQRDMHKCLPEVATRRDGGLSSRVSPPSSRTRDAHSILAWKGKLLRSSVSRGASLPLKSGIRLIRRHMAHDQLLLLPSTPRL